MRNKKNIAMGILTGCGMLLLILDSKTALEGANLGLEICIQTIIPSLFPFIFLSGLVNSTLFGKSIGLLKPLVKFCRIPNGAESILLLGFLGGYPVGAQTIAQAYWDGNISEDAAKRMLGFCNNAGPAFLFGMFSFLFSNKAIPWFLWIIHIASALLASRFIPKTTKSDCKIPENSTTTVHKALQNAIRTVSVICGWVILFRILILFCEKWFLWLLPVEEQIIFAGLLELSNACIMLQKIPSESVRFLFASGILAFGGLCVGMQTQSVTQKLGCGYYFPGKILHTMISLILSALITPFLFTEYPRNSFVLLLFFFGLLFFMTLYRKKLWHLRRKCCIIPARVTRKEQKYAVSKKFSPILQLLPAWHRNG